jgi:hypothetical protein
MTPNNVKVLDMAVSHVAIFFVDTWTQNILAWRPQALTRRTLQVTLDPSGAGGKVMSVLYRRGAYATHGGSQWCGPTRMNGQANAGGMARS